MNHEPSSLKQQEIGTFDIQSFPIQCSLTLDLQTLRSNDEVYFQEKLFLQSTLESSTDLIPSTLTASKSHYLLDDSLPPKLS